MNMIFSRSLHTTERCDGRGRECAQHEYVLIQAGEVGSVERLGGWLAQLATSD